MDQHELRCAIKDMALELGRTPTRDEFKNRYSMHFCRVHFGSYTALVQASGLDPTTPGKKQKIDNSVWRKDLEGHLEEYRPKDLHALEPYKRCVFIPDTHFPFHSQRVLDAIYRFIEKEQPEYVIQVGDLYDRYSHARFPRSHNVFVPEQEDEISRKAAEEMWREVQKAAPGAKCVQQVGNHDLRPLKQILSVYPQMEKWAEKMLTESMTFEGVESIMDPREEYRLPGNVEVIHGYRSKLGDHRDYTLTNVVCGHQHVGGVSFRQIQGRVLWELNVGLAGDPASKGLSYTPQRSTKWTLGWGWLDEYGPRFIPLGAG